MLVQDKNIAAKTRLIFSDTHSLDVILSIIYSNDGMQNFLVAETTSLATQENLLPMLLFLD